MSKPLLLTAALIVMACSAMAQKPVEAVLLQKVQVPVMVNGRAAGSMTLQAGTPVKVLQTAGTKALIATQGETKAWVDAAAINLPAGNTVPAIPMPTPPPTSAPIAAPEPETTTAPVATPSPAPSPTPAASAEAEAEYQLGLNYKKGVGVEKDQDKAIAHFRKAAELGSLEADLELGNYVTGGVRSAEPVDWARVIAAWRKDAENGNVHAQFALGGAYQYGRGGTPDRFQAAIWYEKAALQGNKWAQGKLDFYKEEIKILHDPDLRKAKEKEDQEKNDWETMLSWKTWPEGVSRIPYIWKNYPIEKEAERAGAWQGGHPCDSVKDQAPGPVTAVEEVKNFNFDRTVIIPNVFTYIALPMIKQDRSGECVGAAAVNIIKHHNPSFSLDPSEFFNILNDKKGSNYTELSLGVRNVGFWFYPASDLRNKEPELQKLLERNFPLLYPTRVHEMTIVGYNAKTKTYIGWDQKGTQEGPSIETPWGTKKLPKGGFLIPESSLVNHTLGLLIPMPDRKPVNNGTADRVEHIIHKADARYEPLNTYLEHALPPILKELFAKYGAVEIDTDSNTTYRIDPVEIEDATKVKSTTFLVTNVETGKTKKMKTEELADFMSGIATKSEIAGNRMTKEQKAALRQLSLWTAPKGATKMAK